MAKARRRGIVQLLGGILLLTNAITAYLAGSAGYARGYVHGAGYAVCESTKRTYRALGTPWPYDDCQALSRQDWGRLIQEAQDAATRHP